ncbi:MAG: enoyl-CoA hydratase/isomerase family protein [Bacteroidales bacterium]|nr:enoyl-CoA hydratase/isomerase family protein [Bacteroidales bacterium]
MLYQSQHIQIDSVDGIATLRMAFPDSPVNTLTPLRLLELESAIQAVTASPCTEILVIRSGWPGGFCGGDDPARLRDLTDDSSAAHYAQIGQRILGHIADAAVVSLAFLEGPCLGPGLELALACDYRIAVAEPHTCFGFPRWKHHLPPCWGGYARLSARVQKALSREPVLYPQAAQQYGLIDDRFSRRRAKIELRRWLDHLQARPRKRAAASASLTVALAQERIAFRRALRDATVQATLAEDVNCRTQMQNGEPAFNPVPPFPTVVTLMGDDLADLASEIILRGSTAIVLSHDPHSLARIHDQIQTCVRQGRINPIEQDAAMQRLIGDVDTNRLSQTGLVIVGHNPAHAPRVFGQLPTRAIVAVPEGHPTPDSVRAALTLNYTITQSHMRLLPRHNTSADTVHTAMAWFATLGWPVQLTAVAGNSIPRATLIPPLEADWGSERRACHAPA